MSQLINKTTKQMMAEKILYSHSFFKRVRGLLGYSDLDSSQTMWIKPCSCIHTLFMKFPIDVVFVDKNLCVQSIHENIAPWKVVNIFGKALNPFLCLFHPSTYRLKSYFEINSVFEFKGGHLSKCSPKKGDYLHVGS